ncbi:MAG: hypothetical protein RL110_1140 [Bacteroidota bacterium]|jgi:hypothetical protein
MKEFLNILILLFFGITYLVSFTKVISAHLNKLVSQRNNAIIALYLSVVASSGIILIEVSNAISDAFMFFYDAGGIGNSLLYSTLFFLGAWAYSFAQFHLSFLIVSFLTKEDEKSALNSNHMEVALLHGVVLVILAFLVGPSLSALASSLIPYPELPF